MNNRTSGPLRAKATGRGSQQAGVRVFFHDKVPPNHSPGVRVSTRPLPQACQGKHEMPTHIHSDQRAVCGTDLL